MRIILIQTVLFGLSGVLSSYLNANQHFALPALAPIALDIGYVAGLFLLTPTLGIHGLAWGTVLGGVATHPDPGPGAAALSFPLPL